MWLASSLVRNVGTKGLALSADHPDHVVLFTTHVSRKAAGRRRAILEGVGLDSSTITACFNANPLDDEAAVQEGLTTWTGGQGRQPPTWGVLIEAMEYAGIAQMYIYDLEEKLGMLFAVEVCNVCLHVCMVCMCTCVHACMHSMCFTCVV